MMRGTRRKRYIAVARNIALMAGMNPGPNRNAQWCAAMSDRLAVTSDAVSPPAALLRRVTIDSRLIAPTTRMAASSVREVMKPIADVRLKRRTIGYSVTAVPMPATAHMNRGSRRDHAVLAAVAEDPVGVVDQRSLESRGSGSMSRTSRGRAPRRRGELAGVAGFHQFCHSPSGRIWVRDINGTPMSRSFWSKPCSAARRHDEEALRVAIKGRVRGRMAR